MTDKVINLPVITKLDLPVDRILEEAIKAELSEVVLMGYDKDGGYYFASSKADGGDVLWLLEYTKRRLFESAEGLE